MYSVILEIEVEELTEASLLERELARVAYESHIRKYKTWVESNNTK
jgi:hypothetical protein